jgi:hypothetical protein
VNGHSVANIRDLGRFLDGLRDATPLHINVVHGDQSGETLVVTVGVQSPKI